MNARIVGAPGYVDLFAADVIPGLHHIPAVDGRGDLTVVVTEVNDYHVVPSSTVYAEDGVTPFEWEK